MLAAINLLNCVATGSQALIKAYRGDLVGASYKGLKVANDVFSLTQGPPEMEKKCDHKWGKGCRLAGELSTTEKVWKFAQGVLKLLSKIFDTISELTPVPVNFAFKVPARGFDFGAEFCRTGTIWAS